MLYKRLRTFYHTYHFWKDLFPWNTNELCMTSKEETVLKKLDLIFLYNTSLLICAIMGCLIIMLPDSYLYSPFNQRNSAFNEWHWAYVAVLEKWLLTPGGQARLLTGLLDV